MTENAFEERSEGSSNTLGKTKTALQDLADLTVMANKFVFYEMPVGLASAAYINLLYPLLPQGRREQRYLKWVNTVQDQLGDKYLQCLISTVTFDGLRGFIEYDPKLSELNHIPLDLELRGYRHGFVRYAVRPSI